MEEGASNRARPLPAGEHTLFYVEFEPVGRRGSYPGDQSILEIARQLDVDIISICGGVGSCERCRVQIIAGEVSKLTLEEEAALTKSEIDQGYRLACQVSPLGDVKIHVPPESLTAPQRTQVEGLELVVSPEPAVKGIDLHLIPPTIDHPLSDEAAIWDAAAQMGEAKYGQMDFRVMQNLSTVLRNSDWQVRVALRGDEIIALAPPRTRWLGFAVDIGTTKIAGYLLDLESGVTLASKGIMNPQIAYGEDVVARIVAATKTSADAVRLQKLLVDALNQLLADLCSEVESFPEEIVDAVVVGNTAIHHLFLCLPVRQLGLAPYVPAVKSALDVKARDLGLRISPGAYVHLLPNVAGYVGADHVAMLLATQLDQAPITTLAIDIGTNTEICLNDRGTLTSVSCASGPAFEGAHIKFGMRAAPGAIEHMRIQDNRIELQTISGAPPVGICGSGLLDIVAELRTHGIIDRQGRLGDHQRVRSEPGGREFMLVDAQDRLGADAVTLTQKDIRELQLAKAAIRMGIQALVEVRGITENDLQKVIIAGAFGTFIDVTSAIKIGMLPDLPLERFVQVGNAAGTGARLALISLSQRRAAARLAAQVTYIELANLPGFQRKFAMATYL